MDEQIDTLIYPRKTSVSVNIETVAGAELKTTVRWKIFFVLLLLVTINYVDRASLSVGMPLIAKDFDLSPAMQGLLLSSFSGPMP